MDNYLNCYGIKPPLKTGTRLSPWETADWAEWFSENLRTSLYSSMRIPYGRAVSAKGTIPKPMIILKNACSYPRGQNRRSGKPLLRRFLRHQRKPAALPPVRRFPHMAERNRELYRLRKKSRPCKFRLHGLLEKRRCFLFENSSRLLPR